MAIPIVLYDENHERVGETYHRRAKQLVRSGRAVWIEDGQSLQMASQQTPEIPAPPPVKEELIMTENVFTNNGIAPEMPETPEIPHATGVNELRMYLAKQNVARKRNLVKNIVAYVLVWALLLPFGMVSFTSYTSHSSMGSRVERTAPFGRVITYNTDNRLEAYIVENIYQYITNAFQGFSGTEVWAHSVETMPSFEIVPRHTETVRYVHPSTRSGSNSWFFMVGIMFAWGIWILTQGISMSRQHLQNRPRRPHKPDPVELEYQRLSSMGEYM